MRQSPQKHNIQESLENLRSVMVDTVALQEKVDEITGFDSSRPMSRLSPRKTQAPVESPQSVQPKESQDEETLEQTEPTSPSQVVTRRFKLKPGTPKLKPRPTRSSKEQSRIETMIVERSPEQAAILGILEKQRISPAQARLQRSARRGPTKNRFLREQEERLRRIEAQKSSTILTDKDFSSVSSSEGTSQRNPTPKKVADKGDDLSPHENVGPNPEVEAGDRFASDGSRPEEESVHELSDNDVSGKHGENMMELEQQEGREETSDGEDIGVKNGSQSPVVEEANMFVSDSSKSEKDGENAGDFGSSDEGSRTQVRELQSSEMED